jgi:diaminopropionate ammonia-lyase
MRELAAVGIVAGETGAAGLAGLLALQSLQRDGLLGPGEPILRPDSRVLLFNTEGATDPAAYAAIVGEATPGG